MKPAWAYLVLLGLAQPAVGLDLQFSGPSTQTFSGSEEFTSYQLPIGPYHDGVIPTLVAEGPELALAWQVQSASGTTLGVADNLRQQIEAIGFELLYECQTQECGGFDFRFGTKVLPEPNMHIDLGDFRYLAAQRLGGAVPEYLSLFISRSDRIGYVQLIHVGGLDGDAPQITAGAVSAPTRATIGVQALDPLIERLEQNGSAVLQDVQFGTGTADLADGDYQTLTSLLVYLRANPERRIALVGHTDAVGALAGNIALSRQRANAARRWLVDRGIPDSQVEADGVGYLAPVASNLTPEGRRKNRRVEVILTSTR